MRPPAPSPPPAPPSGIPYTYFRIALWRPSLWSCARARAPPPPPPKLSPPRGGQLNLNSQPPLFSCRVRWTRPRFTTVCSASGSASWPTSSSGGQPASRYRAATMAPVTRPSEGERMVCAEVLELCLGGERSTCVQSISLGRSRLCVWGLNHCPNPDTSLPSLTPLSSNPGLRTSLLA